MSAARPPSLKPAITTGKQSTVGWKPLILKKSKDLEDENQRLKQMFADLSLECQALKYIIEKKL